ncbi:MAG: hypothetical protein CMH28_04445 [Micavibrio sp.]|nr:hypothetical protein [Micavibrio sp.]|tara:strand:+ start:1157 stop:1351 length:195 start_codon:yes stop_codon:yes gene_type:complete
MGLFGGAASQGQTAGVAFGDASSSSIASDPSALVDAINELGHIEELTIAEADREHEAKKDAPQP